MAILAVAGMEATARLAFDFPLYEVDGEVGYWLSPDQRGTFLFTNDWAFNSESLGVGEEFRPTGGVDVLLVGDSIVYGGNGLRQADKLGPLLERRTGWHVWPLGTPGWALQNELAFLRRDPSLVDRADVIVFVLESMDFAEPTAWKSPYTHPRERPAFYLPYLFDRYVLTTRSTDEPPFPMKQRDVLADWLAFARSVGKPVIVVAYSNRFQGDQACSWVQRAFTHAGDWSCFDGLKSLGQAAFRDDIHPSVAGNRALAAHLEVAIASSGSATVSRRGEANGGGVEATPRSLIAALRGWD
jgi:hypothetical protein